MQDQNKKCYTCTRSKILKAELAYQTAIGIIYLLMAYRCLEQLLEFRNPSNGFQDDRILFEPVNIQQ